MGDPRELSRRAIRPDLITEVHLEARLPQPPAETMKLPGFNKFWQDMNLFRERDIQSLHRFIHSVGERVNGSSTTTAGEKGDKGDQGDAGPPGAQGIQGIQGPAGADGADGSGVSDEVLVWMNL